MTGPHVSLSTNMTSFHAEEIMTGHSFSTLHIHLYLVYKKLKYFTTQTCEVIKNKTNSWNKYTSHLTLHTYMADAFHHTTSPKNYSGSKNQRTSMQ